jgi:hypothetical protein
MPKQNLDLFLTEAEKALVRCDRIVGVPVEIVEAFQESVPNAPVFLTLDELDDLAGCVAAEANHTTKKLRKKQLDHILSQIEKLLAEHESHDHPT